MSVYLDASVLVALFTDDPFTKQATGFLEANPSVPIISDFAAVEFASTIARHVRTKEISPESARLIFTTFDVWTPGLQRVELKSADVATAETFLRRLDLTLRAPDALHIAICQRVATSLLTFDKRMAASARTLGVTVAAA
jgi:predicted nucleic acid-binding protein